MILEAYSEVEKNSEDNKLDIRQQQGVGLELLVTLTRSEPKYTTIFRQELLKEMCETLILVFTQASGLIEVLSLENVAKNHACKTVRGIMDVYSEHSFCITVANSGKIDVKLPKHQTFGGF